MKKMMIPPRLEYLLVMSLFGCLGPLVRAIGLPSAATACLRAWISGLTLLLFVLITRRRVNRGEFRRYFFPMLIAGIGLAGDWIGLFTAYNYTSIATATICYYTSPVIVFIALTILLKERFRVRHLVCILVSFLGMALVTGIAKGGLPETGEIKGILFALLGAVSYAGVVVINRKVPEGDPLVRTMIQLLATAVFTTPYVLGTCDVSSFRFTWGSVACLLILGVIVTAFAYIRYFDLIVKIPSKTVAIFAYADPMLAVLISVGFMGESLDIAGWIGAILIIGSAIVSEGVSEKGNSEES